MYPEEVIDRAYLSNSKSGLLILINILEMVCIIVNMAAVIFVCDYNSIDISTFLILLNYCDNTLACSWQLGQ